MKIEEYFATKILASCAFYKSRLPRVTAEYRSEVEKIASKFDDRVLAEHFRKSVDPKRIGAEVSRIEALVNLGRIVEADQGIETLQHNLDWIDRRVTIPVFAMGLKQRSTLKKAREASAETVTTKARNKHAPWITMAKEKWKANPGFQVNPCAAWVKRELKLPDPVGTIANVIRPHKPQKSAQT